MPPKRVKKASPSDDSSLQPAPKRTRTQTSRLQERLKSNKATAKRLSGVATDLNPAGIQQGPQDGQVAAPTAQMVPPTSAIDPALSGEGVAALNPPILPAQQQPTPVTQVPNVPIPSAQQKKAAWTDEQPGAQRISPFSQDVEREPQGVQQDTMYVSSSTAADQVVPTSGADQTITQDNGFDPMIGNKNNAEADKRRAKLKKQLAAQQATAHEATARQANALMDANVRAANAPSDATTNDQTDAEGDTALPEDAPASASADDVDDANDNDDAAADASFHDAPEYEPPPRSNYANINLRAKEEEKLRQRNRTPQSRMPWKPGEVDALIDYINRIGCSWSLIKEQDQHGEEYSNLDSDGKGDPTNQNKGPKWLLSRSQVNLKDKARNMKMDYLKARAELPPNFDKIMLDKKAKDKLEALGIEYTQKQVRQPR